MVRSVTQEIRVGLGEEAPVPAVPLGKDDLVEQFDARVLGSGRLALVYEFVEGLCLPQHIHIVAVSVWDTLQELVHVEVVNESLLPPFSRSGMHIAPVGVEEGCEASHKRGAYLVCTESNRADDTHHGRTPPVHNNATTIAPEDVFIASLIANFTQ